MKVFITFSAGGDHYIQAGNRLISQAKATGYFDRLILYTDKELKEDTQFWDKHSSFIINHKRGYGYWLWKSYIIKKTMETMHKDDILMYLDCGCEIGGAKQLFIPQFFDYVKNDKIIGTLASREKSWTKMDLILHLGMQNSTLLARRQHQAGALLFSVCDKTIYIVDLWYNTGCNYHMIDDSPSKKPNLSCFREHRHDQSIFSLLTKKHKIFSNKDLTKCIYYIRNKTGVSKL